MNRAQILAVLERMGDFGYCDKRVRLPMPRCDAEFALLTKALFGRRYRFFYLHYIGRSVAYELEQNAPANSQRRKQLSGLVHRTWWMLETGGCGRTLYGSAKLVGGHRARKRLEYWIKQRQGTRPDQPRTVFLRLAERLRARRDQLDSR